jgi:hypothetical protein
MRILFIGRMLLFCIPPYHGQLSSTAWGQRDPAEMAAVKGAERCDTRSRPPSTFLPCLGRYGCTHKSSHKALRGFGQSLATVATVVQCHVAELQPSKAATQLPEPMPCRSSLVGVANGATAKTPRPFTRQMTLWTLPASAHAPDSRHAHKSFEGTVPESAPPLFPLLLTSLRRTIRGSCMTCRHGLHVSDPAWEPTDQATF